MSWEQGKPIQVAYTCMWFQDRANSGGQWLTTQCKALSFSCCSHTCGGANFYASTHNRQFTQPNGPLKQSFASTFLQVYILSGLPVQVCLVKWKISNINAQSHWGSSQAGSFKIKVLGSQY